jgi:tRNA threonylcarbamoyladenosine biosynthesis protein TsaE
VNDYLSENVEQTRKIAFELARKLKNGNILCLYGQLGSGKTTFVQALAKDLGINKRIISPTFIIIRGYKLKNKNFYHIDLYRTESKDDLIGLGIPELFEDKKNIIAIEWAEKLGDLLPNKRLDLFFEQIDHNKRKITIKRYD